MFGGMTAITLYTDNIVYGVAWLYFWLVISLITNQDKNNMTKTYKINGKEIKGFDISDYATQGIVSETLKKTFEKINEILEALDGISKQQKGYMLDLYSQGSQVGQCILQTEESKKEWKPEDIKRLDEYWFINARAFVDRDQWTGHNMDILRLKTNNIFQTEEKAEAHLKEILES